MDQQQRTKRVVVCGGGVIGVCTAYFLAKKGAHVTLVEKTSVACAASGKAAGFLALDWCDDQPIGPLARTSFNLHRSLAEELNGFESYGYRPLTTLSLTVTESQPPQSSGSEPSSQCTIPDWIDGSFTDVKTIGSTETTAQVHPALFAKTLLSAAVDKYGVQVVIGKLEEVGVEGGRVESVVLEGGEVIDSDAVVLALGPWSCKFEIVASIFRVYGVKVASLVLKPKESNGLTSHVFCLGYYSSNGDKSMDPEIHPRLTGEEVYISGGFMSAKEEDVPDDPEQVTPDPESINVLKRVATTMSRHLEDAEVKAEQACLLPITDDDIPVIGELPGVKGCYVATGHGGWGILTSPATGAAVAELVMDGCATTVDLAQFSPARFLGRQANDKFINPQVKR